MITTCRSRTRTRALGTNCGPSASGISSTAGTQNQGVYLLSAFRERRRPREGKGSRVLSEDSNPGQLQWGLCVSKHWAQGCRGSLSASGALAIWEMLVKSTFPQNSQGQRRLLFWLRVLGSLSSFLSCHPLSQSAGSLLPVGTGGDCSQQQAGLTHSPSPALAGGVSPSCCIRTPSTAPATVTVTAFLPGRARAVTVSLRHPG